MSMVPDLSHATWHKSSHSNGGGGECVEWTPQFAACGTIPVRDSKNPQGPALTFTPTAWTAFVDAVASGELGQV
ncbi:DUF397 domain-containing protein [Streptomyces sp. SL13]|uniref:DUF397 domain-containing protein n=1 Tax=Streptantibioticus silvisoli TaxID=2705255 RepID=A0AA90H2L0_9ACTN|nr:DUF397 domain-containing protein [Streptantibioticus silvisoli]MDI5967495.1 DUF397 domain-containing protein [Streptantibioticus silvisoli]MDI5969589.1 DUF397 domain-containing protein [Streptantibioticus silvisoli]